jgi:hypothetical protein
MEPSIAHQTTEPFKGHQVMEPFKGHQAVEPFKGHQIMEPSKGHQAMEPSIGHRIWHAPKFLVRPKKGLNYSRAELWKTWGTFLALSIKRGRGVCWSFEMGLGRVKSFSYLFEPTSNQPTSWLIHFL